jgi:tetratricopeptide (TPR) repeat protein
MRLRSLFSSTLLRFWDRRRQRCDSRNPGLVMLGFTYHADVMNGFSADPARDLQRASELAQSALALDDTNPGPYMLFSLINLLRGWGAPNMPGARNMDDAKRHYALAADYANRGIALDPSEPYGYNNLGSALIALGEPAEGIEAAQKAMRIDPQGSDLYLFTIGWGYVREGLFNDAIFPLKHYLIRYPDYWGAHFWLVLCYSEIGQKDQAQAEASEVRRLNPNFSLKRLRPERLGNPASFPRYLADLREAGLS